MIDRIEASGDARRDRFTRLYHDHYHQILAFALRRTSSAEAALDVVAETFLTLWRRLDDAPPAALPWLFTVARNLLVNQQRADRRYLRLTSRLAAQPAVAAPDAAEAIAGGDTAVSAAFARLRPDEQQLLELVAVVGLRPAEVARLEGCSATKIRVRLHRARTRFARELARQGLTVRRSPDAGHVPDAGHPSDQADSLAVHPRPEVSR